MRALVVLREGCRSAQYEGSCSARREGCCTIRRYLLPLNLVEVSLAPGHVMSGALICENYDMVQCCFELVVTDELRFQACGHGDAVECFQRREIRFNTSTFTQLRSLASTDHDAAPLSTYLDNIRDAVRRQVRRVLKYVLVRAFSFRSRTPE